jgi:hypothetical protein
MKIQDRINNNESFLVANDDQFLGKLTLNRYDSESISNQYGNFGNKYSSTSILNKYSPYGSKYSSLSPYNQYTSTPPIIYLRGRKYGFLTTNKYVGLNRLDPDQLFDWMKQNQLNY